MRRPHRPADVDHAEEHAGRGIVDRRGRAPPRVLLGEEVLGREHLHRALDRQRRPDRVRAGAVLRPQHPLAERDPLGAQLHLGMPLDPQDPAVGVADHHHVLGVERDRAETAPQRRQRLAQRRRRPRRVELVGRQRPPRMQVVRVQTRARHPRPRLRDHGAHGRRLQRLPRPPQDAGVRPDVRPGVDRDERITHRLWQRYRPMVGIVANPASGRDIRRLVAGASVFGNPEKAGMVFRVLTGLAAAGVDRALMMPAADGLGWTLERLMKAHGRPLEIEDPRHAADRHRGRHDHRRRGDGHARRQGDRRARRRRHPPRRRQGVRRHADRARSRPAPTTRSRRCARPRSPASPPACSPPS